MQRIEQPYEIQANDIWFFQTFLSHSGAVGGQHLHKDEVCRRLEVQAGPGKLVQVDGVWYWESVSDEPSPARTDEEIITQTEELADKLAEMNGFLRNSGRRWYDAKSARGRLFWKMACIAQELLTNTDVGNAVANTRPVTHDSHP